MARTKEDIIKDRLEDTRREIDQQQAIIENDRKSSKEKEAARKRQIILIEREYSILEKIASLEERRILQAERHAEKQEKQRKQAEEDRKKQEKFNQSITDALADQISSLKVKENLSGKISDADELQLNQTIKIQKKLKEGKITFERAETAMKALARRSRERASLEESVNKSQQKQIELQQKIKIAQINSSKEYVNGIEQNIRKIPILGDLMANTLMGPKAQRKLTAYFYKFFKKNSTLMKAGGGGILIGSAITRFGVKLAMQQSEVMKDIRRTLGFTNDEASEFRDMSKVMLGDSNSMATTQKEILEAASQLSNTYGNSLKNNEKLVNSQLTLTKGFGLQGEEAEKINMLADVTGQDYEKQLQLTIATAQATGNVYKYNFNNNKILADVAKLSASIQASFKGSTVAMAKAVVQTKIMGTTLAQLDSVADNLLQIESSIENQVTAQLVTGRNINLDKARMLALDNKLVEAGQELVNQGINYADFGEMNRVEQQATAAAMGMQKDELADMLLKQEVYKRAGANIRAMDADSLKLNDEKIKLLAKQGDEEAQKYINAQKQLSIQDRMTAAMEKFSAVMESIYYLVLGLGVALSVAATISSFGLASPVVAAAWGGAAGLGSMITAQYVQDGIAPASNGPFTITDNKGRIGVTSAGDGLVATPNKPSSTVQPTVNVSLVVGNTAIKEIGNKIAINNNYNAGVGNSYNRLG